MSHTEATIILNEKETRVLKLERLKAAGRGEAVLEDVEIDDGVGERRGVGRKVKCEDDWGFQMPYMQSLYGVTRYFTTGFRITPHR